MTDTEKSDAVIALERMRCPWITVGEPIPEAAIIEMQLAQRFLPPIPADFMPEFSTLTEGITEVRVALAYSRSGQRWGLCYLLSDGHVRMEESKADPFLRACLWLIICAAEVVHNYEICADWLRQCNCLPQNQPRSKMEQLLTDAELQRFIGWADTAIGEHLCEPTGDEIPLVRKLLAEERRRGYDTSLMQRDNLNG